MENRIKPGGKAGRDSGRTVPGHTGAEPVRITLAETLEKTGIMVIDGSMATALEAMGCNLRDSLWTAKALLEQPELVKKVHTHYFEAGADCGITCSYQATIRGLTERGYTRAQAETAITDSVKLFQEARSEWWERAGREAGRAYPLCLAGIGPFGAYLADGSEYRGLYQASDAELLEFHARRAELLYQAGADILLFETQPSLKEVLLEADIAEKLGADYWVSFSCMDGKHINEGGRISECARILSQDHPHLKMIGVNCTQPKFIAGLIRELKNSTSLPIAVYPNSGEVYDPVSKTWKGAGESKSYGEYAFKWMQAGASAVGGCCTTVETHVSAVRDARSRFLQEAGTAADPSGSL